MKTNRVSAVSAMVAVIVATILSTFTTRAVAGEKTEKSWTTTLSIDFVDKYVGFDNGAVFYKDPMFQTVLAFCHKSGFYANIWWGTGLDDNLIGSGFDDEIDYNIGYSGTVPRTDGKVGFDIGVGYWDMYDLFKSGGFDMIHPLIEINCPVTVFDDRVKLTPFIKWQAYLPFDQNLDEGTMTSAGCKYRFDLGRGFALTGLTSFGYDDGGFGFQRGIIWKDYLNLEVTLSSHLTWRVAEAQFYIPLGVTDRDTEQVYGTGLTWTF